MDSNVPVNPEQAPELVGPKMIKVFDFDFHLVTGYVYMLSIYPSKGDAIEELDDRWKAFIGQSKRNVTLYKKDVMLVIDGERLVEDKPVEYVPVEKRETSRRPRVTPEGKLFH